MEKGLEGLQLLTWESDQHLYFLHTPRTSIISYTHSINFQVFKNHTISPPFRSNPYLGNWNILISTTCSEKHGSEILKSKRMCIVYPSHCAGQIFKMLFITCLAPAAGLFLCSLVDPGSLAMMRRISKKTNHTHTTVLIVFCDTIHLLYHLLHLLVGVCRIRINRSSVSMSKHQVHHAQSW